MIIICNGPEKFKPGDRVIINNFDGKLVDQPCIILKESIVKEYIKQGIDLDYINLDSKFYEVSTD